MQFFETLNCYIKDKESTTITLEDCDLYSTKIDEISKFITNETDRLRELQVEYNNIKRINQIEETKSDPDKDDDDDTNMDENKQG